MTADFLGRLFDFDSRYSQFELLETENGVPGDRQPQRPDDKSAPGNATVAAQSGLDENAALTGSFAADCAALKNALSLPDNQDVIAREFKIGQSTRAFLLYMSGMANAELINDYILRQSMAAEASKQVSMDEFITGVASIGECKKKEKLAELAYDVLCGLCVVLIEKSAQAAVFETRGFVHRGVEAPNSEKSQRGPNEGFTGSIRDNITLIRRIVKTGDLVAESVPSGGNNNIMCAVMYRKGLANEKLIAEVRRGLANVKTNCVLGNPARGSFRTNTRTILPLELTTERPDRTAEMLMSGHVAVLSEGAPAARLMPATFAQMMTSPDDYYMASNYMLISRMVRSAGFLIMVLLPAFYIAAVKFHQSVISTEMINTILIARRMVALPVELELLILLAVFQIIKEAGLRVPGDMGQSISVVAALVLGQASVNAKFTSSIMLILVAIAALGNYSIPEPNLQYGAVILQLVLVAAAALAGFFGLSLAAAALICYMFSLKSFGIPLFAPYAPKTYAPGSFWTGQMQHKKVVYSDTANPKRRK